VNNRRGNDAREGEEVRKGKIGEGHEAGRISLRGSVPPKRGRQRGKPAAGGGKNERASRESGRGKKVIGK